jgi:heme/copper-type cytochrome/quinol oxidase subunit 3
MAIGVEAHAGAERPTFAGVGAGKLAMWWFLASEIMLFGGLIAAFIVFRVGGGGWHEESSHLSVPLAALNTLVLLTSSLTVVQAYGAAERGDAAGFRTNLLVTIALGAAFLAIKAFEYTGKIQAGYMPGTGIFWSFYYTMTGLHALHVLGGVILNALLFWIAGVRRPDRVELAGLYWHFVDVVWIFLFPLVYLS